MKTASNTRLRRLPARTLVLSYLLIIMTTSIVFSAVFYVTTSNQANAHSLGVGLIIINIAVLAVGAALSYWLARRTLRPIETALDKQDQYIADASHELRTPLASALLSNEIALKNSKLTLLQARSIIQGNVKDMEELRILSDELLRESETQSRVLNLVEIDTHAVTQEAIQRLAVIAAESNTTIKNKTSALRITTDADMVRKVLVILIENAIKYSPGESTITVTSRHSRSNINIVVADQGVGIDSDDLGNIFNRFYRTEYSRMQTAGYGLGLAIAKKLIEEVGGSLSVKSIIGEGSTFTIKLPTNTNKFTVLSADQTNLANSQASRPAEEEPHGVKNRI